MPNKQLTKTQSRLYSFLKNIPDEEIRDLIIEVIVVEVANRSSSHFPIQEIRDQIDSVARLRENVMVKE